MKKYDKLIETCKFIPASALIPDSSDYDSFWDVFGDCAPFSYGDNNKTLITAERFADRCDHCFDCFEIDAEELTNWIKSIRELGQMYIDLES